MFYRLFKWIFSPLFPEEPKKKEPIDELSDFERMINYEDNQIQENEDNSARYTYRPMNFNDYIGQNKNKNILQNYINGVKKYNRIFPHTLIYGNAGFGKTTLAKIIANELNVTFSEIITSNVYSFDTIRDIIKNCNGGIVFLDEIHSLSRDMSENLYTILEDFTYRGKNITPFTMIGATTELGEIIKTRKPFYDRFKVIVELENYKINELVKIIRNYSNKTFQNTYISINTLRKIVHNCRGSPRNAIRLLEATVYYNGDIDTVLNNFNIKYKSLTDKDIKLLSYLLKNKSGVGLQSISAYLDIPYKNYVYDIEPFLLKNNLVLRTNRGRIITTEGVKCLKQMLKK